MRTCSRLIQLQQKIIEKQHKSQMFQSFIQSINTSWERHTMGTLEVTQENKIWTHSHEIYSGRRDKTYTNRTSFMSLENEKSCEKGTDKVIFSWWKLRRQSGKGFGEKLHFSYDLKYRGRFGTGGWMQWTHVIISLLSSFWYIVSVGSIC